MPPWLTPSASDTLPELLPDSPAPAPRSLPGNPPPLPRQTSSQEPQLISAQSYSRSSDVPQLTAASAASVRLLTSVNFSKHRPGPRPPAALKPAASSSRLFTLDLETTGLSTVEDRVTEIAVACCSFEFEFQTLVNPGRRNIPDSVAKLTNITNEDVRKADVPGFALAAERLEEFLEQQCGKNGAVVLAIHNGRKFDIEFLKAEYKRCSRPMPAHWRFVDTLEISRAHLHGQVANHKLLTLAAHFNASTNGAHRAMADAKMLRAVIAGMKAYLEKPIEDMAFRLPTASAPALTTQPAIAIAEATKLIEDETEEEMDFGEDEEEEEGSAKVPPTRQPRRQEAVTSITAPLQRLSADPLLAGARAFYEDGEDPLPPSASSPDLWMETAISAIALDKKLAKLALQFSSVEQLLRHYPTKYTAYEEWHPGVPDGTLVYASGHVVNAFPLGTKGAKLESRTREFWRCMIRALTLGPQLHPSRRLLLQPALSKYATGVVPGP